MKSRARTAEDCEKSYRKGMNDGIRKSTVFFGMVTLLYMADKLGFRQIRLSRFIDYLKEYAGFFNRGEISSEDIQNILKNEYDIEIKFI